MLSKAFVRAFLKFISTVWFCRPRRCVTTLMPMTFPLPLSLEAETLIAVVNVLKPAYASRPPRAQIAIDFVNPICESSRALE